MIVLKISWPVLEQELFSICLQNKQKNFNTITSRYIRQESQISIPLPTGIIRKDFLTSRSQVLSEKTLGPRTIK